MIPPLDMHAHIEPDIAPSELAALRACVVAMTRRLDEYRTVTARSDASVVWGVGCHPGLVREVKGFSASGIKAAIRSTPVIGEVGLDGAASSPMEAQLAALRGVLALSSEMPRLVSIHSYKATELVLRELQRFQPEAAVLHWWLGTPEETEAAVEAGAYFSVNASQASKWKSLPLVPPERVFLETDHPFGDRAERATRRPGNLARPEAAVAAHLGLSPQSLRLQTWRNLKSIAERLSLLEMFPRDFQVQFLAA
jgi:TatD DNase family protein